MHPMNAYDGAPLFSRLLGSLSPFLLPPPPIGLGLGKTLLKLVTEDTAVQLYLNYRWWYENLITSANSTELKLLENLYLQCKLICGCLPKLGKERKVLALYIKQLL